MRARNGSTFHRLQVQLERLPEGSSMTIAEIAVTLGVDAHAARSATMYPVQQGALVREMDAEGVARYSLPVDDGASTVRIVSAAEAAPLTKPGPSSVFDVGAIAALATPSTASTRPGRPPKKTEPAKPAEFVPGLGWSPPKTLSAPGELEVDITTIEIRKGIPMPRRVAPSGSFRELLERMSPGDMIELPFRQAESLRSAARKFGFKVAKRKLRQGVVGIWMVA